MLRELSVQNLALIEDVRVELLDGYCAWTGETGAGKSLLLTALGLLLGGKASPEMVRAGKSEARASAVFEVSDAGLRGELEAALGGPLDDGGQLILTRRVSAQGRGSAQANGVPVTVATLQALGALLIDVHGQDEGRALADPDRQRALLDAHGGLGRAVDEYRRRRSEYDALRRRRLDLVGRAHDRARERAMLEFERDELAALGPKPGEPDALGREAHRLANSGAIRSAAAEGYSRLYEADCSVQGVLERVARMLAPLAGSVPEFADAAADLDRLADDAREVAYSLRNLARGWEDDPDRLDEVEARLAHYRRLSARFRCPPDDLAARLDEVTARLDALDRDDADLTGLDAPLIASWVRLGESAARLSAGRKATARSFARAIRARLGSLGLGDARLDVEVTTSAWGDDPAAAAPPEAGADRVEFVFSANPGEPPRPLRKVASGGELSRVTLAAKAVLAGADRVPTLVFDEIDTGVGGRLGAALGKTLAELAGHRQIICVTHLPQTASYARGHWVIRKQVRGGRARTTITPLEGSARVDELAAMLRGESAAEGTRKEAMAMLLEAGAPR